MNGELLSRGIGAFVVVLLLSPTAPRVAQGQESFEWTGNLPAGSTLQVFTVTGRVDVQAAQGQSARVEGRRRLPTGRSSRRAAEFRFEQIQDGNRVTICALYEGSGTCTHEGIRGSEGRNLSGSADFVVRIPAGVALTASSGNGDVTVDGATAAVRARSGNGDVRIGAGATRVDVNSGNGRVRVDDARGPVEASSGNGQIHISTRSGPVNATSGNGRIEVRIASLSGSGDMSFRTGNGSVRLYLPDDFAASVEARTGNGGVSSDFPLTVQGSMSRGRLIGTIGNGGRQLRISSGNGDIEIRRAATR